MNKQNISREQNLKHFSKYFENPHSHPYSFHLFSLALRNVWLILMQNKNQNKKPTKNQALMEFFCVIVTAAAWVTAEGLIPQRNKHIYSWFLFPILYILISDFSFSVLTAHCWNYCLWVHRDFSYLLLTSAFFFLWVNDHSYLFNLLGMRFRGFWYHFAITKNTSMNKIMIFFFSCDFEGINSG